MAVLASSEAGHASVQKSELEGFIRCVFYDDFLF